MSRTDKLLICVSVACIILTCALLGVDATQTSVNRNDSVWACGRKVPAELAENRVWVRGMRKDCGIYGEYTHQATPAKLPARGACVDIRVGQEQRDQWANQAGSGEMLQTEKVRC